MTWFFKYIVFPVLLLLWARSACYVVDYGEFAYVTRFGERVTTRDGGTEAGLYVKMPWPVDSVLRVDRRLQSFDLPAVEVLTRSPDPKDKGKGPKEEDSQSIDKTLTVDAFVTWRIPDGEAADQFIRSVGTPEQVKRILAPQFTGRLAAVVGALSLDQLIAVGTDAQADERANDLQARLLGTGADDIVEKVRRDYGIEIVALRLRRLSFPEAVRTSIYERIRSERGKMAAKEENKGRVEATKLLAEADRDRRKIEADARAKKTELEGKADTDADRIRNEAHAKDPDFYAFLQRLKALQAVMADSKDTLLLSLNHDLFKLMKEPPKK